MYIYIYIFVILPETVPGVPRSKIELILFSVIYFIIHWSKIDLATLYTPINPNFWMYVCVPIYTPGPARPYIGTYT